MFLLTLKFKQMENSGVSRHFFFLRFPLKANEAKVSDPPKSCFFGVQSGTEEW